MMIRACIFDLDGTLADTLESMSSVANRILGDLGLKKLPTDNFRYYSGEGADMLVKRCLMDAGDKDLVHYEEMRKLYRENLTKIRCIKSFLMRGIPEILDKMKEKGLRIAVCSNKPHEAAV